MRMTKEQRSRFIAIRDANTPGEVMTMQMEALITNLVDKGIIKLDDWLSYLEQRHQIKQAKKFDVKP